jgi:hypothetical protein
MRVIAPRTSALLDENDPAPSSKQEAANISASGKNLNFFNVGLL